MRPQVLIVDDSLTVRMDLQEEFASIGFAPTTCATLSTARQALKQRTYSLAVLDVLMPDGSGIDLLQEIKSTPETAGLPVILLSTEAEVRDRVRGLKTGADEYVGKPYDTDHVLARARQLVGVTKNEGEPAGAKLLLVDDSPTFRNEFKLVLENAGYAVVTAETGEDGLRAAVTSRPDAVIVNGVLPGVLDGGAVIRRLKDDVTLRDTPCLLLTAEESTEDELRKLEAGADAYVRKATDVDVILARIVALLRSLPPRGEIGMSGLLGPKRILAVDDSATYLHELAEELHQEGYDIIAARSGKEALELLEVQPVDCILLDLLMPGLSGQETCQIIKSRPAWRNIPLLILTSVQDAKAMVEGINAGADDYVPKSSDFAVLKARVRAQLRRKQFEDEYRNIRERLMAKEVEVARARASQEIAQARAAYEPLLRNEAWLNKAVRLARLGAWDWDVLDNPQTWSDQQFRNFGLAPGSVAPTHELFLQAVHEQDRVRVEAAIRQALAGERSYSLEFRIIRPGGEVRYLVYQGEIHRNEAGQALRATGTSTDVTEQKMVEERLRKAAQYARNLIEASLDPLVTISRDGLITDVNHATENATGVPRERLIGSDFADYFTDSDRARRSYQQVFSEGFVRDYPLAIRSASGGVMDVLYNASVFRNETGEVEGVFAAARDVTKRTRAEQTARRLAAIVESSDDAIISKSLDGIVLTWNQGAERMYGYTAAEMVGRSVMAVVPAEYHAEFWELLQRIARGDRIEHHETVCRCKDGRRVEVSVTWSATKNARGEVTGAATIVRDITARKRAEDEIRKLNEELETRVEQRTAELQAANQELEAFTYSVSHDLRSPLRHLSGFSKLLLEENEKTLSRTSRHYVDEICDAARRMGQLVDDLLELSRMSRQALHPQPAALDTIVEEVRRELAPDIGQRAIEWKISALPPAVGDPALLRQVYANLLANAVKFTRTRDLAVIEVGGQTVGGETTYFVRDNGVGFDMRYVGKLFGIFQRLHRAEDFEGTGVGLALVQRIVHRHGGRVWAEAKPDRGACFYFTLGCGVSQADEVHDEVAVGN